MPDEYKDLCKSSYAGDVQAFANYFSLRKSLHRSINIRRSPFPPTRMLRPRSLVFWNALKGGVDEYSGAMKRFIHQNSAEHPVVTIVTRMIMPQICNAAISYRLIQARKRSLLGRNASDDRINKKTFNQSYRLIRHRITRLQSLGSFIRTLAIEYKSKNSSSVTNQPIPVSNEIINSSRMFSRVARNAAHTFNTISDLKELRLQGPNLHTQTKGTATYCSLCGYSYTYNYNNKAHKKSGGQSHAIGV